MTSDDRRAAVRVAVNAEISRRGWTVKKFAEEAGADPGTVGDFLGGTRWPRYKTLGLFEEALGWPRGSIPAMLEGADPPKTQDPNRGSQGVPVGSGVDPQLLVDLATASPEAIEAVRAVLNATKGSS